MPFAIDPIDPARAEAAREKAQAEFQPSLMSISEASLCRGARGQQDQSLGLLSFAI